MARLKDGDIVLFADADTTCLKPIRLSPAAKNKILLGGVALAPDIIDRHFQDVSAPWYLAPRERGVYVNSGVIFASRKSSPFFEAILRLSAHPEFLEGPFQDQKVINFALGRHFPGQLVVLDKKYNAIRNLDKKTVIAHFAGGAGLLGGQKRRHSHLKFCSTLLNDQKSAGRRIATLS